MQAASPGEQYRQLGYQAFDGGRYREAVLYLEKYVRLEKYSAKAHFDFGKALLYRRDLIAARSPVQRSGLYQNYKRAAKHIRQSLVIAGYLDFDKLNVTPYMVSFAEHHFHLAMAYWFAGLWDRALTHFRRCVLLNPRFLEAYYNMAAIYESQNKMIRAQCYFRLYLREKRETGSPTFYDDAFRSGYNPIRNLRCYK